MNLLGKLNNILNRHSPQLLIAWVIILSVFYSLLSILRHIHFESAGFDLGIYDQAVWQYSQFLLPYNTIKERLILGDHLTLTLPLLSFLFWIWNDVKFLLIFQAIFITISTFAIYKIARIRNFSPFVSLLISFSYSIFYGIQFAVYFDFHPVIIGAGLLAWIAYFLEAKKTKLLVVCIILLLLTQENMGIALASLGLVYVFSKKLRKRAIIFIIIGLAAAVVSLIVTSMFSSVGYEYSPIINFSPVKITQDLFNSDEKRQVWLYSYSSFSFIPLLSPGSMLAVLLDNSQYFVTGDNLKRMWSPYTHHRIILALLLVLGTMNGFTFLGKKGINPLLISTILIMVSVGIQYYYHFPLSKLIKHAYWRQEQWMINDNRIIDLVPKDVSIATQQNLIPHLSHRKEIYLLWPRVKKEPCEKECWWLDFSGKPKYIVVDVHPNQSITALLETSKNFNTAVENMREKGKLLIVAKIGDAALYRVSY